MDDRPPLPNYDPDYCHKVTKWAAGICVGWFAIELFVLVFVDPGNSSGMDIIHPKKPACASTWELAFFTGLPAAWIVFVALNWKRFSHLYYDGIVDMMPNPRLLFLNWNIFYLIVMIGWSLFCAIPLVAIIDCTCLGLGIRAIC